MKKLSIKEKTYDGNYKIYTELINRLEDIKDAIKKQNYGIAMDILCKPYPEYQITTSAALKESEDEKIRKAIRYAIEQSTHTDGTLINNVSREETLAWLEKQGEQKPAWSEEDKNRINRLIAYFEDKESFTAEDDVVYANWLKSLKDRVQPNAEWSEEDEAMYQGVIETEQYMLEVVYGRRIFDVGNESIKEECAEELAWLKSIRFKKLRKPSKEQIIALQWVLNNVPYNKYKEEISGLLDQIKEL